MLMLNLPHLPVGMRRRCQVFLPVCCVWPCCFPLNETWLTVMLTESITFKLLILCHKPRETDFFLSPAVLKESRNHKQLHATCCLLQSRTARMTWSPDGSKTALQKPAVQLGWQQAALLLAPGHQKVTSPAPYRSRNQEPQVSCRAP